MTLTSVRVKAKDNRHPRIVIFGVGGGGGNAVKNMTRKELQGVEFVIANTDAQALRDCSGEIECIQLGEITTQGLGAGANPEIGRTAAEETKDEIKEILNDAHLCFITSGMGGGTGTGASPIIAKVARDLGVLTVGVVTKPFFFEGTKRMEVAEKGIRELEEIVNTLLVIPNQNLFSVSNDSTTTLKAFELADDVLYHGVKSITDLMVRPGLINLDFADVNSVLKFPGRAMMGVGSSDPKNETESRGQLAALNAMNNQLLEETNLHNAKGVLINIIGGEDQTLFDLSAASEEIRKHVNDDVHVIVGTTHDPDYTGKISVSLVATGLSHGDEVARSTFRRQGIESEDPWEFEPEMHDLIEEYSDKDWVEEEINQSLEATEARDTNHFEPTQEADDTPDELNYEVENIEENPFRSFTAPKRITQEELSEVYQKDMNDNEYEGNFDTSEYIGSSEEEYSEEESVEEIPEQSQVDKNFGFKFGFLGRREKPVEKLKVPAFIRRQAN